MEGCRGTEQLEQQGKEAMEVEMAGSVRRRAARVGSKGMGARSGNRETGLAHKGWKRKVTKGGMGRKERGGRERKEAKQDRRTLEERAFWH